MQALTSSNNNKKHNLNCGIFNDRVKSMWKIESWDLAKTLCNETTFKAIYRTICLVFGAKDSLRANNILELEVDEDMVKNSREKKDY